MTRPKFFNTVCFLLFFVYGAVLFGQEPTKPEQPNTAGEKTKDEVLRINTNLIQTGISVFDAKGQFVNNLKQEDFELRVDGQPISVSFFEQVAAKNIVKTSENSKTEQDVSKSKETGPKTVNAVKRSRNVLFLVDDLHLSFDSLRRMKDLILKFIELDMEPDDIVGIVSTNGKLGFLQQLTNDKTVLRVAVAKLNFTSDNSGITRFSPRMTEYEALLVDRRDDEMTEIFTKILAKDNPGTSLEILREQARSQARTILLQAAAVSRNTYVAVINAIRSSGRQPGRKIVFLLSEGFLLDTSNTDASQQMTLITDAAARTNSIIYSFDAKGLTANMPEVTTDINSGLAGSDASSNKSARDILPNKNFTGNSYRVLSGERFESQDGLNWLAENTGGRFIHDTNDLQSELKKALDEASAYYLLAWEPDFENDKAEKLRRIVVSIKGRPDLKVRLQKSFTNQNQKDANTTNLTPTENSKSTIALPTVKKAPLSIADEQLNEAVISATPKRDLPTALSVNYLDLPNKGATMAAVLRFKSNVIEFTSKDDEATANVDLLGVFYDSTGKRESSFRKLLTINVSASQLDERPDIYYNYQTNLKPGLYQVRVAVRDVKSGITGSDNQWIEIPDLTTNKLALSSLLFSEQSDEAKPRQVISDTESALAETEVSVDRIFERSSQLRYLLFIYNAAHTQTGKMSADVTLQTEILREKSVVVTTPARQISTDGADLARLPYIADVPLEGLTPGRYELQVTVQDRIANTSISKRLSFEVK